MLNNFRHYARHILVAPYKYILVLLEKLYQLLLHLIIQVCPYSCHPHQLSVY